VSKRIEGTEFCRTDSNLQVLNEETPPYGLLWPERRVSVTILPLFAVLAGHWFRTACHFVTALPAQIAILFLSSRDEPKTAARLAQDCRTKKPLVKPYLLFYSHRINPPVSDLVTRALVF